MSTLSEILGDSWKARAEAAEAERDALRAQVEAVRALADEWGRDKYRVLDDEADPHRRGWRQAVVEHAEELRAALSSSEPVTAGEGDAACTCCDEAKKHSFLAHPDCPVHNPPAGEVTPPAEQRAEHHPDVQDWLDNGEIYAGDEDGAR